MQTVTIQGQKRENTGKASNKAARKQGLIPAIVYGGGEQLSFSTTLKEVKSIVYTPEFKLAHLNIDGTEIKAILKDIQFHPVTDSIMHLDFLRIIENTPIKFEVPIRFKGESPGVKTGGKLIQQLRKAKVKSTPSNMVDQLVADISELQLGGAIRIRDLEVVEGIEVGNNPATPIATVEVPRALKSAEAAAEKEGGEEAPAEGEGEASAE